MDIHAGGETFALGSDKARGVLAALAVEPGRPLAIDVLADAIWDESPPQHYRANLHTLISRVRRALREAEAADPRGPAAAIERQAHTYALVAPPEALDWQRFRQLTEQARGLAAQGDDAGALAAHQRAEQLWRGEPLAGLPGLWAQATRTGMAEQRLAGTRSRFAIELRLARFGDLVPELLRHAEQYPTDEVLAGQLMTALYGCGRAAEALDVFARTRGLLRERLGADPGEPLARTHERILRQAALDELVPGLRPPEPILPPAADPVASNLPSFPELIGREDELSLLAATHLAAGGGVTTIEAISGMAGVGKTALAVRTAEQLRERYPDGQLYLDLRAHSAAQPLSAEAALAALLRLLGVPAGELPQGLDALGARWRDEVAGRRLVVVLDDALGREQIQPLLPGRTSSAVLITSRLRLAEIPGAKTFFVDVLHEEDAVSLFRELVGPERTGDLTQVRRVVARCGYLPLAVEIAASRFKARPTWTLEHLIRRLSRGYGRLGEIRDGYRDIARVFEMSYRSLSAEQRMGFRRLGLHPGPHFGPGAAAALIGEDLDRTERILEDLLNCHLLQEPSPDRYRFHDLLGEFARALADAEEPAAQREAALGRLTSAYLHAADLADRMLYPSRPRLPVPEHRRPSAPPQWSGEEEARRWLTGERPGLVSVARYAARNGMPEEAAWLAHVLADFLDGEGYWYEAEELHDQAAAHWRETGNAKAEARALLALTAIHTRGARYVLAVEAGEAALVLARSCRDSEGVAEALSQLGVQHLHVGEYQIALDLCRQSLELRTAAGDQLNRVRPLNNIAITLARLGDLEGARKAFTEALAGIRQTGDRRREAHAMNNIGSLYLEMGDRESAQETLEKALALSLQSGTEVDRVAIQITLANALSIPEELPKAIELCRTALGTCRRLGDRYNAANAHNCLGQAYAAAGRHGDARNEYRSGLSVARSIGAGHEELVALRGLGSAEAALEELTSAHEHLAAAVALARTVHAPIEESHSAAELADVQDRLRRPCA